MLKTIEKLYIKLLGKTRGYDFNMCDWDIMSLDEHWRTGKPLTKAEAQAMVFLKEMGDWMEIWDPTKRWKKPYGKILNETRKLH